MVKVEEEAEEELRLYEKEGLFKDPASEFCVYGPHQMHDWWFKHRHQFPRVFKVAMSLLSTQGSTGSLENDFSSTSDVLTRRGDHLRRRWRRW